MPSVYTRENDKKTSFFTFHLNKQKIYIPEITDITYTSQTSHILQYISIISQVIQVLHHSQLQVQIEVSLTTTSIITANETDLLKDLNHEALYSMSPIDSVQRKIDCICKTK